jgi:two-component system phosphate regulon sensor histidine kinase PhoR
MSVKRSLKIVVIIVVGIGMILSFLLNYFITLNLVESNLEMRAKTDVERIIDSITTNNSFDDLDLNSFDYEVEIIDDSFKLIAASSETKDFYFSSDVFEARKTGNSSSISKEGDIFPLEYIYSQQTQLLNKNIVIRCKYKIESFEEYKSKLLNIVILFSILSVLFIYLVITTIKREYKKPLVNLAKSTSKVNPSARDKISIDTNDAVILTLVGEFNNLIDNYNSLIEHDGKRLSYINSFLSNLSTGIIVFGLQRNVKLMNNKAGELLHLHRKNIFLEENVENESYERIFKIVNEIIDTKESIQFDIKVEHEKILEIEGIPFYNRYSPYEFSGVVLMIRDVTKLRELEVVQREFVSNVSHELKTPLAVISGYAQTLLSDENNLSDSNRKMCLDSIYKETDRLSYLIAQLLELARINENRGINDYKDFNPFDLVEKAMLSLRGIAKNKNIIIVTNVNYKKISINSNSLFFYQILNNLVNNAIKYSPTDSKIIINQKVEDNNYSLKVFDRGFGIPDKDIKHIFERFYRVDKSRNSKIAGSGLGLSIAKDLITKMGGRIDVESEIDKGSIFTVLLPIKKEKNET